MRIRGMMLAAVAATVLTGCGREPAPPSPDEWRNRTVTLDGNRTVQLQEREGSADAPLPMGLPAYPNVEPESRRERKMPGPRVDDHSVEFYTRDRPEQVADYYRAAAARLGLQFIKEEVANEGDASGGTIRLLHFRSGDTRIYLSTTDMGDRPTAVRVSALRTIPAL